MPAVSVLRPPQTKSSRAKLLPRDEVRDAVRTEERPEWERVSNLRTRLGVTAVDL
jgi:hypothetical protein